MAFIEVFWYPETEVFVCVDCNHYFFCNETAKEYKYSLHMDDTDLEEIPRWVYTKKQVKLMDLSAEPHDLFNSYPCPLKNYISFLSPKIGLLTNLEDLWRDMQVALEGSGAEPETGKKQASGNSDREKDLVITYGRLGEIYSELGNQEEAENTFRIFLDRAKNLAFQNPGNSRMLRFLFVACIKNAGILSEQCEYTKAQLAHQAAFFIAEQYLEKNPVDAAWLMNNWKAFEYVKKLRKLKGNTNDQSGN